MSTFAATESQVDRWEVHKVAAACLRAVIVAVPLPLSAAVGVFVGWTVSGDTAMDIAVRVVLAGLASVASFIAIEWVVRRLLPLAVLLRLSLVFPDRAPSRFAVALRSTSVRRLREWARTNQDRLDEQALAEKVLTLASALNFHDRRTRGHSERTRALAELVIDELGLSETEANEVRWGAFLHDIGKLLVPSSILNKAGTPSPAEWEQLRQHPAEGGRLVRPLRPFIGAGVDAVSSHHESYDGTGYPNGLRGEAIALPARIVAVVDSFEVMTAVRSYKRPMSATSARQELVREAGKQFDPHVVRAFLNVSLGRLHWALGVVAWVAELPFIGIVPRAAAQVGATVGAGSSAVSTATLASVATVSLGASLMVNPLATPVPAAASTAPPASSVAVAPSGSSGAGGVGNGVTITGGSGVSASTGSGTATSSAAEADHGGGATDRAGSAAPGDVSGGSKGASTGRAPSTGSSSAPVSSPSSGGAASATTQSAAGTGAKESGSSSAAGSQETGGSTSGGSSGTSGSGTTNTAGALPVVSTVLDDVGGLVGTTVGGLVGTTVGALGKLGSLTTGKTGSTTSKGQSKGLLGL